MPGLPMLPLMAASAGTGGMSPATAMLIASAIQAGTGFLGGMFGGGDDTEREPFRGGVDPELLLGTGMEGIQRLAGGLAAEGSKPVRLRNAGVQPIEPISVPGLPFQIGGGFGTDPAMADPSLLTYEQPDFTGMDIFQTQPRGQTRRRSPTSQTGRGRTR